MNIPFDLLPDDFLNRAEGHLKQGNLEDSLANSKRAIECQIDCLLYSFGLFQLSKKRRLNFPRKIEIISDLGITSPRILQKVNILRNKLEHEYKKPKLDEVEDAFDIGLLFSKYVERYWKKYRVNVGIEFYKEDKWMGADIDPEGGFVIIVNGIGWEEPFEFSMSSSDNLYLDFLKDYLSVYDDW